MTHKATGRPRGRPPKPAERKRLIGNPGGRKLPASTAAPLRVAEPGELVEPHRPLGRHGRELWDRLVTVPWIASSNLEMAMMVCEQMDERSGLRGRVIRDGDWRERSQLRALDTAISAGLGALGFDPTSRSRIGVGDSAEPTELSLLRAKRQQVPRPTPSA